MNNLKKGFFLALGTALISGFANFFNKFGMNALGKDAFQYTALKNIVVAAILTLIIFSPFILKKIKNLSRKEWLRLGLIGLVGGSIPFLLFFKGLSLTSPVSASFIHKTLFVWVAILAFPILKEKLGKLQFLALAILLTGSIIFNGFSGFKFGYAEILILIATILWAVENIIAKITLKTVDPLVVAWGRMFFGSIILVLFLLFTGNISGMLDISINQAGWITLVSVFLCGYVVTWYSALRKMPVVVAASVLVLASPITALLNSIFVTHNLPQDKIWGAVIVSAGVILLWKFKGRIKDKKQFNEKPIS